jgi:hypothetical protein
MERKKTSSGKKLCDACVCVCVHGLMAPLIPFPGDAIAGAPVDWLFGFLALNLSRRCRSSVATAAAQAGARLSRRNRPV